MAENVQTGGVMQFKYDRNRRYELADEKKREINEAYQIADERKGREKKSKIWLILLAILIVIFFFIIVYYFR